MHKAKKNIYSIVNNVNVKRNKLQQTDIKTNCSKPARRKMRKRLELEERCIEESEHVGFL
jgi:hypothetical protein